jgi:MoxR-like ATPase
MQTASPELIGPAIAVLAAARTISTRRDRLALLLDGNPGNGKTTISNALARELTGGSECSIEMLNGQSLTIEIVREWRSRACYGNLFSAWTVKRVDELDKASTAAVCELLTYLDTLPANHALIATTNDYAKLRASSKGRLESRFVRLQVTSPAVDETAAFIARKHRIPKAKARLIALGSVPDGCLPTEGCNVRTALNDAEALAAISSLS